MAGVPWYYDEALKAYRVRPGFKFPELGAVNEAPCSPPSIDRDQLLKLSRRLLKDSECLVESTRALCSLLDSQLKSS